MRPGVQAWQAGAEDLPALVSLCLAARAESGAGSQLCSDDATRLHTQLAALIASPGGQILVGALDGHVSGLLLGRVVGPTPFTDQVALHVEAVYVDKEHRRRGVGHALIASALAVAEQHGATDVYSAPLPGARGMQRFLARLGFAPAAAHRVVTTQALQRRLASEGARTTVERRANARGLEDLIARRRQVRSAMLATESSAAVPPEPAVRDQSVRSSISMHVRRAVQSRLDSGSSTTIS
ncbi:GNAT family N-acetyltransferase [Cellulomonas sp. P24]|uniref:GNAT family N-acetyltransferase n=1 Tax=Cellulomonas sp. P24 TaxID=2885206 RepID=UPI00216B2499|nr:GNAT family N-acetyltransferase [Cellulomonas sp. P24]MCR6494750.1 GNAT family N-acetyltransferase [Cellulomonas sp. P24]